MQLKFKKKQNKLLSTFIEDQSVVFVRRDISHLFKNNKLSRLENFLN